VQHQSDDDHWRRSSKRRILLLELQKLDAFALHLIMAPCEGGTDLAIALATSATLGVLFRRNEMAAVYLMKSYCVPALTYAREIWNMSSTEYQRINVMWNNTFRCRSIPVFKKEREKERKYI